MLKQFDFIFFDAGGTLFRPWPSVGEVYEQVAARFGSTAKAAQLEKLFHKAWLKRDGLSHLAGGSSEKIERDWWKELVLEVFTETGGISNFENFFHELYDVFGHPDCWRLYEETVTTLENLKDSGKKLGIISNWDSRLFQLCDGLGIRKYFDFVLASSVFGAAKPSPEIFKEALRLANAQPRQTVHIGDSLEDDIKGASNVGIKAILIDRKLTGSKREMTAGNISFKTIHSLSELL